MAVKTVCAVRMFPRGTFSKDQKGVMVRYKVTVDDERDGVLTVTGAQATTLGLPDLGDSYVYGNDSDTTQIAVRHQATRINSLTWQVDVYHATESIPSIYPRVITESQRFEESLIRAKFAGHFDIDGNNIQAVDVVGSPAPYSKPEEWDPEPKDPAHTYPDGDRNLFYEADPAAPTDPLKRVPKAGAMVPFNSAGSAFDPPLTVRRSTDVIHCEWLRPKGSGWSANYSTYLNKVNDASFQITTSLYTRTFAARELYLAACPTNVQRIGFVDYLFVRATFWIKDGGWNNDVIDRGLFQRAYDGSPNQSGGEFGTGQDGKPQLVRIVDQKDKNVQKPVMLDGLGYSPKVQDPQKAVYLRWNPWDDERNFSNFGLFT